LPLQTGTILPHALTVTSQKSKPSAVQSLQAMPKEPHAAVSVPARHLPLESQQPVGHVEGEQAWAPSGRTSG
jgi:hypothetical protein